MKRHLSRPGSMPETSRPQVKSGERHSPGFRKQFQQRRGLASLETVMSAGILIPIGAFFFFLALLAFPYLMSAIFEGVCSPVL